MTIIKKITEKIQNITHSSESDAQKIIVGLSILGIAISWFIIGNLSDNAEEFNQEEIFPAEIENLDNI